MEGGRLGGEERRLPPLGEGDGQVGGRRGRPAAVAALSLLLPLPLLIMVWVRAPRLLGHLRLRAGVPRLGVTQQWWPRWWPLQ